MSLMQDNFDIAAELNENAAVRIQATLRLLEENTDTRIKLKNPLIGGTQVDFSLLNGDLAHVDEACSYNDVTRNDSTLST